MHDRHEPAEDTVHDRNGNPWRTRLIALAVVAALALAGALHLIGVLPPGG